MATKTQYYNLDKPSYDEVADIEIINANMDKIDQQMRNNADGVNFAKGISSDAYDNSKSYAVGDYCIYDNKLYRCITAIESAEEFNIAKWEQTTVGREVKQLNSNLDGLEYSDIAGGKNLLKESTLYITNESKSITDYDMPVGTYTISFYSNVGGVVDFYGLQDNSIIGGGGCAITPSGRSTKTFTVNTPSKLMCYANVSTTITDIQIEEGETATEYEPYIPSVKMLVDEVSAQNESLEVIGKCKNLLNPTLQTTTQNGVTCTNNGDGTYTLNGTASSQTTFVFAQLKASNLFKNGITYKICGCPKLNNNIWFVIEKQTSPYTLYATDYGNGETFTYTSNDDTINIFVRMNEGIVLNNVVLKPMITTDLNATYDDFVPYTGDGDTLTHDVADLKNDLTQLEYSDVAGGKNIIDVKDVVLDTSGTVFDLDVNFENNQYTLSFDVMNIGDSIDCRIIKSNGDITKKIYSNSGHKTISHNGDVKRIYIYSNSSVSIKNIQFEVGAETSYEPYIPSVKMIAEENIQQSNSIVDMKMLGWTVPSECPIQNEVSGNQFIQKVGRVDLGERNWVITDGRFLSTGFVAKSKTTNLLTKKYKPVSEYGYNVNGTIYANGTELYICDSSYTDSSLFKSAMQGEYLYYELETPITMTIDGNEAVTQIKNDLSEIHDLVIGANFSGVAKYVQIGKLICCHINLYATGDTEPYGDMLNGLPAPITDVTFYNENGLHIYVSRSNKWFSCGSTIPKDTIIQSYINYIAQ